MSPSIFMIERKLVKLIGLSLALGTVLNFTVPKPANAQYWGYGRWGSSLLYGLGYLALPFNRGPYNANPLYSTASYLTRGSQRALTAPLRYRPYYRENYKDEEPIYDPRSRYRPQRLSNLGQDQIASATWKKNSSTLNSPIVPSYPTYKNYQNPTPSILSPDYDPFALTSPNDGSSSPGAPGANQSIAPHTPPSKAPHSIPKAPPFKRKISSPIADGFVSTVTKQFNGNIENALQDPAARSWAKALGLVNTDKPLKTRISPARIQIIRQILIDPELDSVNKLDAIRILLPSGASRANK